MDVFRHSGQSDRALRCVPYSAVIYMTETQGSNVLKHWRENGISVPVIVICKSSAVSVRAAFLNAGADDWLPDPTISRRTSQYQAVRYQQQYNTNTYE